MPLLTLQGVDYSVGGPLLLEQVDLSFDAGERIALIGRNGAGKSTLLRLMLGELHPDGGEVRRQTGVRVAALAQEVPLGTSGDVFDVVVAGLGELGAWLAEYHHLSHAEVFDAEALGTVQGKIESVDGWSAEGRVEEVLQRMGLDGDVAFESLSGGMKRRVLLARALVAAPEVLLLDEPTNHLDLEAIDWLEGLLREWPGCVVFVTHDRRFLRAVATRIVEIDRGRVTSWPGDWDNFLRRRDERLHAEAQENARFDKMLAQEEVWIRQGIKARRVRDEGRVRRLEQMRRERAVRRAQTGSVKLDVAQAESSGRKVIEAKHISFGYGGKPIIDDLSTIIWRGDRIGLIGPNGIGKTTLLKLLLGQIAPQQGEVKIGSNLQVAYFDQYRATLREDWNALDNVSEGREFIEVGERRKHVLGYLQDFLFTPERARAPITRLSGGERNRLLLAKLFAQPANLLVMDEPTNDLDVETLELLEDLLADWPGTLLLVSHDREFLDQVVTSTLVMEGDGKVGEFVGGYSDWLRQRRPPQAKLAPGKPAAAVPAGIARVPVAAPALAPAPRKRLGQKQARELAQLPARIETLEKEIAVLGERMNAPGYFQQDAATISQHSAQVSAAHAALDLAYSRWSELEGADA